MQQVNGGLRNLTWDDYGISKDRYQELKHFCLQYQDKKRRASMLGGYDIPAVNIDGVGGHTGPTSPTERAAIKNYTKAERALRDCRMIEEAALWAAAAGGYRKSWRAILRAVSEGVGYDRIITRYAIPFSVADFYAIRRAFFWRLDCLQQGEETQQSQGIEPPEKFEKN